MARSRFIKPGLFINDTLAELPISARYLFAGLWTIADREGRLQDRPRKIKAQVLPFDDEDVDKLLQGLHDKGFIVRYVVDDDQFIGIVKWHNHQKPHPREVESIIPPPPIANQEPEITRPDPEITRLSSTKVLPRQDQGLAQYKPQDIPSNADPNSNSNSNSNTRFVAENPKTPDESVEEPLCRDAIAPDPPASSQVNETDPDVHVRVNDVYSLSKAALLGSRSDRVNDVYTNDIGSNEIQRNDNQVSQALSSPDPAPEKSQKKISKPPQESDPAVKSPDEDPFTFAQTIATAAGYERYTNKGEACKQAKEAIRQKLPCDELAACVRYMLETNGSFWATQTLTIASAIRQWPAYQKAKNNGWKPGDGTPQKGIGNGVRSNSREVRNLPPLDGGNTEYAKATIEVEKRQAEYRRTHGIGVLHDV